MIRDKAELTHLDLSGARVGSKGQKSHIPSTITRSFSDRESITQVAIHIHPFISGRTFDLTYCRTHNLRVCLYIAYIACGSTSLYIKTLYFFICTFFTLAAATVANIKTRYDAKTPQFAIFGTRVIYVFYSIWIYFHLKSLFREIFH